jgi:PAS domain S-box-containing protein
VPALVLDDIQSLRTLFDSLRLVVVSLDRQGDVEYANPCLVELVGAAHEGEVVGQHWFKRFVPTGQHSDVSTTFVDLLENGGVSAHHVNPIVTLSGEERLIAWNNALLRDRAGQILGTLSIGEDMTAQRRAEEVILRQARDIIALSTPVLQIWEGVLLAPLIGTLEGDRALRFTERLLQDIVATGSRVVLLDVTGVPLVDTGSARSLTDAIAAARLVGADVIVTGMRPALAQTIVELGIELPHLVTRGSLQAGLRVAMTATARK